MPLDFAASATEARKARRDAQVEKARQRLTEWSGGLIDLTDVKPTAVSPQGLVAFTDDEGVTLGVTDGLVRMVTRDRGEWVAVSDVLPDLTALQDEAEA